MLYITSLFYSVWKKVGLSGLTRCPSEFISPHYTQFIHKRSCCCAFTTFITSSNSFQFLSTYKSPVILRVAVSLEPLVTYSVSWMCSPRAQKFLVEAIAVIGCWQLSILKCLSPWSFISKVKGHPSKEFPSDNHPNDPGIKQSKTFISEFARGEACV